MCPSVTGAKVSCWHLTTMIDPSPPQPIASLPAPSGSSPSTNPASALNYTMSACASTRSLPGPFDTHAQRRAAHRARCARGVKCSSALLTVLRHRVTISTWTPLYVSWCCLRCCPRSFAWWRLSTPIRLRQRYSRHSPAAAWSSLRGSRAAHGLEVRFIRPRKGRGDAQGHARPTGRLCDRRHCPLLRTRRERPRQRTAPSGTGNTVRASGPRARLLLAGLM
jgi:hypothetical protein